MKIETIDPNMAVSTRLNDPEIEWHSARESCFSLHGLYNPREGEGPFTRMPVPVAEAVSEGVAFLNYHTAGGRVRFVTDSPWVAIHAELSKLGPMDHMAMCGIFGFDLYVREEGREVYRGTFRPGCRPEGGYESRLNLPGEGEREVTINFPLYNGVDRLFVGVKKGSLLRLPGAYAHPVPVVYYGSSITQGGCASRPGNSYQAMISRMLDCDYVNLGFSGSARGEQPMAEYIAGLPMSVFVCDYDHNAPSPEHLAATHGPLYRAVRARHPETPILFVTMPDVHMHEENAAARRAVVRATYEKAVAEGDARVAFIDGAGLFEGPLGTDCTVDGCHPNDLGFYRMAQVIGAEVARWL